MSQQTAVQFLVMKYHQRQGILKDDDIEQAKAIEKEQIIDAWNDGICIQDANDVCGEYYYDEKFKK